MLVSEALIEFPIQYEEYDGAVEHTELTDVDRAVGSFFQMLLDSLYVVDGKRKENAEFARFCEKDRAAKLYSGEFADPQEFLRKLVAKTGAEIKTERNEVLPAAYITRDPVISFCDDEYKDISGFATLCNNDDLPYANVNKSFVLLTYKLTAVAWSKATLSRMALGLMLWARHVKKGRKHVFQADTMLAGSPVKINIELVGRKEAMSEPAEVDHESTRLFASTVQFEVIAEVLEAESMSVKTGLLVVEGRGIE